MLTRLRQRTAALLLTIGILASGAALAVTPDGRNSSGHTTAATDGTGGSVSFPLPSTLTWTGGRYLGISGENPSATATSVVPWVAPGPGVIKNFAGQGLSVGQNGTFTIYRAVSNTYPASLSYSATALSFTIALFTYQNFDNTHTVTVAKGDCILIYNDTTWSPAGASFSFQYVPS